MVDCFSNSESAQYRFVYFCRITTHSFPIVMPIRAELRGVITAASGCYCDSIESGQGHMKVSLIR